MAYTGRVHPDPHLHRVLLAASRVTLREPVRGYEMGQDGRLPFSGFARYFEHMRWELGRRGYSEDPNMPRRGVVRAQTHRYLGSLRFPGEWTGRTHLIHVGGSSLHYGHDITREDGVVVVQARTVVVLLRLRHQLLSGRARRDSQVLLVEEATALSFRGAAPRPLRSGRASSAWRGTSPSTRRSRSGSLHCGSRGPRCP